MESGARLPLPLTAAAAVALLCGKGPQSPVGWVTLTQLSLGFPARLAFRIWLHLAGCALRRTDSPCLGSPFHWGFG